MVPPILQARRPASRRIFFFRGKVLDLDLGRGAQRKVDFALNSRQAWMEGGFWVVVLGKVKKLGVGGWDEVWCFRSGVFWELEGGGMKDVSDKIWSPQLDRNDDGCRRHMTSPAKRLLKARRLQDHNQHSWLENGQFCPWLKMYLY